jgi:DNA-directed RNA polymerase subunit M/transcription elongation factor TFIIS
MSSTIACPGCKARLQTRPEYVGKKIRCPRCSEIVRVPTQKAEPLEALEEVEEVEELDEVEKVEEERGITGQRSARRPERRDEAEGRRSRSRDRIPDIRKKKGTQYAPCPECGSRGATRVVWTPWGSFYGPAMFTHVRCPECGYAYNGNTGGSNLIPAIGFVTVTVLVGLGFIASIVFAFMRIK